MSALRLYPGSEWLIEGLGRESTTAQRLAQMGILPGSHLQVRRLAPMGDTVEVSVDGGQSIALRAAELLALDCRLTALPLSAAYRHAGRRYRVQRSRGGKVFHRRMQEQGLVPGVKLLVGSNSGWPLKLRLLPGQRDCSLGRGEAEKIIVTPLDENEGHG